MRYKTAIFVDWENLRQDIMKAQYYNKDFRENMDYNDYKKVIALIKSFLSEDEEIYRIFFYTAEPIILEKELSKKQPELKALQEDEKRYSKMTKRNRKIQNFLKKIVLEDYFALRLGNLQYKGIDVNKKPILQQKQVDMLIGLDIAHISYNKLTDRILVFCKDIDIVPALKCARNNGIRVDVANLERGIHLSHRLRKHSDFVRTKKTSELQIL